jgi:hypothetical protein
MKFAKCIWLSLALVFVLPVALLAQTATGSISGAVFDPNGASVPSATVVATHVPTGRQYTSVTTQAGLYVFPSLPTGPYTITVKQAGFKTYVQTGIEVRVQLREVIDVKLELGAIQQTIEVKASAPVLETANPTRGSNMSPQQMANLPLWNGSMELANTFVSWMPGVNSNSETSVNGSIGRGEEIMIDGATMVSPESGGVVLVFPGFYAFGEFKLLTSAFTAEYGRAGGGIVQLTTKSGSNQPHGAAFFNFKRDIFDAVPWGTNANPGARLPGSTIAFRPKERFNEEGGYAGGPVFIPHVWDGRNRTFWYFAWTGFWQPAAITVNSGESVPTAAELQGNFSATGLPPIYDPATSPRTQFPGNIIPTTRFSSISKNIIPYIPAPNTGSAGQLTGNYVYNSKNIVTDKAWSTKIDHSIHTRDRIAFFITYAEFTTATDSYYPGPLSDGLTSTNDTLDPRATDDFVINPHVLLHTTWGLQNERQKWYNPLQNGFGTKWGFPDLAGSPQDASPIISFETDLTMSSGGNGQGGVWWGMNQGKVNDGEQVNWTMSANQQLTWLHNKHEFKMGWDIRRPRTTGNDWAGSNGTYQFSRVQTSAASGAAGAGTGYSFASFLLGDVDSANENGAPPFIGKTRYGYQAGFFQDNWRVRPKFTFNIGVRYEVPVGWHNQAGDYSSFSLSAINPAAGNLPGALIYMGSGPNRIGQSRPYPLDMTDVGPRVGFAWNIRPTIVIRSGFGVFFEGLGNGGCGCEDGFGGGSFAQNSDGFNPAFDWDPGGYNPNKPTGNPGGVQPPVSFHAAQQVPGADNFNSGVYFMGPHFGKAPRIYEWSLTLQKDFHQWLFEGAYVGNRGHGTNSSVYVNTLPTADLYLGTAGPTGDSNLLQANMADPNICLYSTIIGCTNGVANLPFPTFMQWGGGATLNQALRPYPMVGTVYSANSGDGKTWYDSFQGKVERRFGNLNFTGSYVYSKTLDRMSYRQIFTQTTNQGTQDSYNLNDAKSYMYMDIPNFVNLITSYRLPVGRGQKFLGNSNSILDHLVGNWTFSADQQYRSGNLAQLVNPTNTLGNELFSTLTKLTATGGAIRTGVAATSLDPNNANSHWFVNNGCTSGCTSYSSAFAATPTFKLGNQSIYNTQFRQPWYRYEAMSLNKQIHIWESVLINYQVNFFNPFNRTDFGSIQTNISSPSFGRPTAAMLSPRNITMGLRLEF